MTDDTYLLDDGSPELFGVRGARARRRGNRPNRPGTRQDHWPLVQHDLIVSQLLQL